MVGSTLETREMWQVSKGGRIDRLVVFADVDGEPAPVGAIQLSGTGRMRTSTFQYGRAWLEHCEKFAIAPTGLPLRSSVVKEARFEVPIAFHDAAPDGWGRQILRAAFPEQEFGMAEYLAATGTERTGELSFGPSHLDKPQRWMPPFQQRLQLPDDGELLEDLVRAAEAVDQGDAKLYHFHLLFRHSADQGGARPKASVSHKGRPHLAKLPAVDDNFDDPRIEAVCLALAKHCGIEAPDFHLERVAGRSVILIERFDRTANGRRLGYSSAQSLLGADPTEYFSNFTYRDIAVTARSAGVEPCEAEIFRRLLFNCFIHNTDEHLKNMGFIRDEGRWRLSPIFDLSVHRQGRLVLSPAPGIPPAPAPESAFAAYNVFGLSDNDARQIYDEVVQGAANLPRLLDEHEVSRKDRDFLEPFWVKAFRPPALPAPGA
jgi:serine/threonine-protein kinase HipA